MKLGNLSVICYVVVLLGVVAYAQNTTNLFNTATAKICKGKIDAKSDALSIRKNVVPFEASLKSVKKYLKPLESIEAKGGELYLETKEGGKTQKYNSYKEYKKLVAQGYNGRYTSDIIAQVDYESTCKEIEGLKKAKVVSTNFFTINSRDWWEVLPAAIIPLPGGLYNDDSLKITKAERDSLISGKRILGELKYTGIVAKIGEVTLLFNSCKEDSGKVHDELWFSAVLLADFNNDGIAELLIKGYRVKASETVWLGTGNSCDAGFTALLAKTNSAAKIVILPYP